MLLLPLVMGLLAFVYSRNQPVVYNASATLLVKQSSGRLSLGTNDFRVSQQLASTYRRLVTSGPFLEEVAHVEGVNHSAGQIRGMVSATTSTDPPSLEIHVRGSDRFAVAEVANVVAIEFVDYVVEQRLGEIANLQSAAAALGIVNVQDLVSAQFQALDSVSLLEPVSTPSRPILPRTRQNVLAGLFAGALVAAVIAVFLETLGDSVRSPEEITRKFGVSVLGAVFKWTNIDAEAQDLVLATSPTSTYAEAFRQVRANFQFATVTKPGNLFLFCSPGPGEGKSTITGNIAIALAQAGKNVVVIDGDLRKATVHKKFKNVEKEPGLSNYLADFTTDSAAIVHSTDFEGVNVIPSGPPPPNPAELLGSSKMDVLLTELKATYDYVLIDSAPILLVADGSILAAQADGAVVVVDGSATKMASLQATILTLKNTQVDLLGVVLNKLKVSRFGYGYGYSYHYYYANYGYYGTADGDGAPAFNEGPLLGMPVRLFRNMTSKYRSRSRA